jgi:hypothetical protein
MWKFSCQGIKNFDPSKTFSQFQFSTPIHVEPHCGFTSEKRLGSFENLSLFIDTFQANLMNPQLQ